MSNTNILNTPTPSAEMARFLKGVVRFVVVVILSQSLLDLALFMLSRVVHLPFPAASYNSRLVNRRALHADIDPDFGVWHQPNLQARQTGPCFDALFTTNRWGARDDQWPQTPAGPQGILLGDSYLEGYGVNENDRASEVFEKNAGTKLLNLATAGHCGPTQYRLIYAHFKDSLPHDFVIAGLNLPNELDDEDVVRWKKKKRYRPYLVGTYPDYELAYGTVPLKKSIYGRRKTTSAIVKNLLNEYSNLYHAVTYFREQLEIAAPVAADGEAEEPKLTHELTAKDTANAWKVIYNLEQLQVLAGARPVYVFFVPNKFLVNNPDHPLLVFIRRQMEEKHIRFLDLAGAFAGPQAEGPFLPCDVHWSIAGNARVGESLAAAFRHAQQLPAQTVPALTIAP